MLESVQWKAKYTSYNRRSTSDFEAARASLSVGASPALASNVVGDHAASTELLLDQVPSSQAS